LSEPPPTCNKSTTPKNYFYNAETNITKGTRIATCYSTGNHYQVTNLVIKPSGMQASIIRCLPQARINWDGCSRKGIPHKKWGMKEVGAPIIRMGWHPDGLSVLAS